MEYISHNLLSGKRGIIFGAIDELSIAWAVAKQCVAEGAQIVLTNTQSAICIGSLEQLAKELKCPLIACDSTDLDDLTNLFTQSQELLHGKIDFILHAVAMSQNLRRNRQYDDANYNYFAQTIDVSALSFHKMLQTAKKLDAINEYGSVVALSYIASQRAVAGYNDMGDAKAILESITRNFGRIYGEEKHVRINTISQSPTQTRAGSRFWGVSHFYEWTDKMSPLGNANAQDCANMCVMLFSDYTRKVTMQTLYNDGGYSTTAISQLFIETYKEN